MRDRLLLLVGKLARQNAHRNVNSAAVGVVEIKRRNAIKHINKELLAYKTDPQNLKRWTLEEKLESYVSAAKTYAEHSAAETSSAIGTAELMQVTIFFEHNRR